MVLDNSHKRRRDEDSRLSNAIVGSVCAAAAGAARNSDNSDNSFQVPNQSMLYTEQASSQTSRKIYLSKVEEDTTSLK